MSLGCIMVTLKSETLLYMSTPYRLDVRSLNSLKRFYRQSVRLFVRPSFFVRPSVMAYAPTENENNMYQTYLFLYLSLFNLIERLKC